MLVSMQVTSVLQDIRMKTRTTRLAYLQYFGEEGETGDVGEYFGDDGDICAGARQHVSHDLE